MFSNNIKGPRKLVSNRQLPPPAPVPSKTEGYLPTRATATKKYKDKLIGKINAAIEKNIGTADPIYVSVINYNVAVVNEVIESLRNAGWDVGCIYGSEQDRAAAITLS
ncbi:hypothetical protein LH991_11710 [Schleiferilactobacillus harbinensis]|uniref:hypothetical protein n=1 Tax=Schleiferilactobacillus harbinensis TaxID=304207 RepID=UPI0006875D71|nr:hypothetical protein [Schleiferilactobacillus harbinensis]QFR64556.1 hypothetical protein LH991_11710 [Schleiferilactobacillus harbinensis]